jgi:D-alanyl-D-alanine carboxypeptidase
MTPARPGHSEHQLGVAIDFRTAGATGTGNFGSTPAGRWLAIHAWEYGFVMSYPNGRTTVTCYDGEPWHFRYVGRTQAAEIHASGETVREYLWANFTNTVVPPAPHSSGPPIAPLPSPEPIQASGAPAASGLAGPGQTAVPSVPPGTPEPSAVAAPTPPIPTAPAVTDAIDPAVAAGALPILVVIAAITFTLIIGGGWLASRRRRPDAGSGPSR